MGTIDKSIPYYNILMRCDTFREKEISLPSGYQFRTYREGDAEEWARLETAVRDFDTFDHAVEYFRRKYCSDLAELQKRFICVEGPQGKTAGIVIAWKEEKWNRQYAVVHWLVTDPAEANQGIGTALVQKLLKTFHEFGEFPVYLHSQPWSYIAIGIYSKCGFRLLKEDTFGDYDNQFEDAVKCLKTYMTRSAFEKLLVEVI